MASTKFDPYFQEETSQTSQYHEQVFRSSVVQDTPALSTGFLTALADLHTSIQKQQYSWQQHCATLEQQLVLTQQREKQLQEKNAALSLQLNATYQLPEQHVLVKQFKMLSTHLADLAEEAAAFNHYLKARDQGNRHAY